METDKNKITLDDTIEDRKTQKKFIKEPEKKEEIASPTRQIYNQSLNNYIRVKEEIFEQIPTRYPSILAKPLSEILENATLIHPQHADPTKDIQKRFEKIINMEYVQSVCSKIKLTVGIKRDSKEKVRYCIMAIENR